MDHHTVRYADVEELPPQGADALSDSPRLFDHPLLDKLSRVHWSIPLVVYVPILAGLGLLSLKSLGLPTIGFAFLCGYGAWTLTEYFGHRYLFHSAFPGRLGARLHFLIHGVHHEHPNDPLRLVMPPLLSLPIMATAFLVIFTIDGGQPLAYPTAMGFLFGYLLYDMIHYYVHHAEPKTALGRKLRRLHMLHHFHDAERGFAISAPWWDSIFGTAHRPLTLSPRACPED